MSFTPENGSTLHVVVVGDNRTGQTQCRQTTARLGWVAAKYPARLDSETYTKRIQRRLAAVPYAAMAAAIGVSLPNAAGIRAGRRLPHPRHWEALAGLVSFVSPQSVATTSLS